MKSKLNSVIAKGGLKQLSLWSTLDPIRCNEHFNRRGALSMATSEAQDVMQNVEENLEANSNETDEETKLNEDDSDEDAALAEHVAAQATEPEMSDDEKAAWNAKSDKDQVYDMISREEAQEIADEAVRKALSKRDDDNTGRELALPKTGGREVSTNRRDMYVGLNALTLRPSMGMRRNIRFQGMSAFIRTQLEAIPAGKAVSRSALTEAIVNHFKGCDRTKAGVSLEFALQRAWAEPYRKMTNKETGMVFIANTQQ